MNMVTEHNVLALKSDNVDPLYDGEKVLALIRQLFMTCRWVPLDDGNDIFVDRLITDRLAHESVVLIRHRTPNPRKQDIRREFTIKDFHRRMFSLSHSYELEYKQLLKGKDEMNDKFIIGAKVRVIELNANGRILAIYKDAASLQFNVRYFYNGEARTVYFFADELELRT